MPPEGWQGGFQWTHPDLEKYLLRTSNFTFTSYFFNILAYFYFYSYFHDLKCQYFYFYSYFTVLYSQYFYFYSYFTCFEIRYLYFYLYFAFLKIEYFNFKVFSIKNWARKNRVAQSITFSWRKK